MMMRIDTIWLATEPLDMRAGIDTALARVVNVFGAAHPHCAYLFANKRANRMKLLLHDGLGLWLATRRLHVGGFVWADPRQGALSTPTLALSHEQLGALVLGLPWQRMGAAGIISVV
jgi:transposase